MTKTLNPNTVRAFLLLSATMLGGSAWAAPQFLLKQHRATWCRANCSRPKPCKERGRARPVARGSRHELGGRGRDRHRAPAFRRPEPRVLPGGQRRRTGRIGVTIHTTSPRAGQAAAAGRSSKDAIAPQSLVLTSPAGRAFAA
ncbi:hypothetical protein LP420_11075 [Massilia sp. B-10]|nr:hypothetical protein LP420_11075 [Massilia sp. B-10]